MVKPWDILKAPDGEIVLLCAVRYACGRRSYIPDVVVRFLTPLLDKLKYNTLYMMERDILEAEEFWGDECDIVTWQDFLKKIGAEIDKRGCEHYAKLS